MKILGELFNGLLTICAIIIMILYTPVGVKIFTHLAPEILYIYTQQKIIIKNSSGILSKEFYLNNIAYNNYNIYIKQIKIRWDLQQLLAHHKILIPEIMISEPRYNTDRIPDIFLSIFGSFNKNNFTLNNLTAKMQNAHLDLHGQWAQGHLEFSGKLEIRNLNLPKSQISANKIYITAELNSAEKININLNMQNFIYKNNQNKINDLYISLIHPDWQNKNLPAKITRFSLSSTLIGSWALIKPADLFLPDNFKSPKIILKNFSWRNLNTQDFLNLNLFWQKDRYLQLDELGKFNIKPANIILNNFYIHARAENNTQKINYTLGANSGYGNIKAFGDARFNQNPSYFTATINITGKNFLAFNTPQYKIWASPDLQFKYNSTSQALLTGQIFFPKASINIPDFKQTVELPDEVVFANAPPKQPAFYNQIQSHLTIILGDNIDITAEGLKAKLAGKIALSTRAENNIENTTAAGNLIIQQGSYHIYNQDLNIKNGRLIFNNNLITNPDLQIQATKEITVMNTSGINNNLTPSISALPSTGAQNATSVIMPGFNQTTAARVGVDVSGTLQHPVFNLFSAPVTLSQADILAYLLFNHPANQLGAMDAATLFNIASGSNIGTSQIEQITREIQNISGLDQFSVESTNYVDPNTSTLKQNTSLVLSKALSPKLYLNYSVGLLDPVNIFTVKYILSSHWLIQAANSSFANSADLIYQRER